MLTIKIDTETKEPVYYFEQGFMVKEYRDIYKKYGVHGVNYAILFGWMGSPYKDRDLEMRHKAVYKASFDIKQYDPLLDARVEYNGKENVETKFYTMKIFREFMDFLNENAKLIDDEIIESEKQRIEELERDISKGIVKIIEDYAAGKFDRPGKKEGTIVRPSLDSALDTAIKQELAMRKLKDDCRNNIMLAEDRKRKRLNTNTRISLDTLINAINEEFAIVISE